MKGHKAKKADGGKIDGGKGTAEEDKEIESKKDTFKHGGKVKKKHGGKVEGKKSHKRADKKARGGKADMPKNAAGMSPTSPLSGAGKTAEPGKISLDKEDD